MKIFKDIIELNWYESDWQNEHEFAGAILLTSISQTFNEPFEVGHSILFWEIFLQNFKCGKKFKALRIYCGNEKK